MSWVSLCVSFSIDNKEHIENIAKNIRILVQVKTLHEQDRFASRHDVGLLFVALSFALAAVPITQDDAL